ncbi:MAG: hypothetical protein ACREBE_11330 [bacterium]
MLVANAGPDIDTGCVGPDGTAIVLDGSQSSVGPDITYLWTAPGVDITNATSPFALAEFPAGTTIVTLTVTSNGPDGVETAVDTAEITVGDTVPPTIVGVANPAELWPPNHKLIDVHVDLMVFDACDANPDVELVSISSSEPDNGTGDGNTGDDIQGADVGTDDRDFALRAERSGPGSGRVYTAVYRAFDAENSSEDAVVQVIVPHDQGHGGMGDHDKDWKKLQKQIKKMRKSSAKAERAALVKAKKAVKAGMKAYKKALKAAS